MDYQPTQPVKAQERYGGIAFAPPRDGYDAAALGVECAWPVAERETLLALS